MKFGKSPPSAATGQPHGFFELAKAHVATHGGEWVVIERKNPAQAQQWRAWIAYFAWLDDQAPKGRKAVVFRALERITVPAPWPLDFDASAPPAPPPEPAPPPISLERRQQLAEMLRNIAANPSLGKSRNGWKNLGDLREAYAARPQPFALPVGEAKPLFADKPMVATQDMAAYLGRWLEPERAREGSVEGAEGF
jgi:hypothetical protein